MADSLRRTRRTQVGAAKASGALITGRLVRESHDPEAQRRLHLAQRGRLRRADPGTGLVLSARRHIIAAGAAVVPAPPSDVLGRRPATTSAKRRPTIAHGNKPHQTS